MNYIYVLRSIKTNKRYIGLTTRDVSIRLKEHNSGTSFWDRNNRPFVLLYKEEITSLALARKREKFFKTGQGRKFLDKIVPP